MEGENITMKESPTPYGVLLLYANLSNLISQMLSFFHKKTQTMYPKGKPVPIRIVPKITRKESNKYMERISSMATFCLLDTEP